MKMFYDLDVIRLARQANNDMFIVDQHVHQYYYHYICVLGGTGEVEVGDTRYSFAKRCFVLIPPEIRHAVRGYKGYYSIDIKFSCDYSLIEAFGLARMDNPIIHDLSDYEFTLVTDMFHEAILGMPNYKTLLNAKLLELLVLLGRTQTERENPDNHEQRMNHLLNLSNLSGDYSHIKPALDYIDSNILTPLSIPELAEMCGYATTYFSSIFKETIGTSPVKYINDKKMEIAKTLMISSNMSITQISDYLGYSSIHYFSKVFKNVLGVSPKSYAERANSDVGITLVDHIGTGHGDDFNFFAEPLVCHPVELGLDRSSGKSNT